MIGVEFAHRQHRVDALALGQRQQIDDGLAARRSASLRQFVHLFPVHLARLEKQSKVSCVLAMNSLSTKSSSLTVVAARPRPPRFCARYSDSGCALT